MNSKVQVSSVEEASGSNIKVTLQRTNENGTIDYATCDEVLFYEDASGDLSGTFQEWVDCAIAGEAGYSAVIDNGVSTFMYSN